MRNEANVSIHTLLSDLLPAFINRTKNAIHAIAFLSQHEKNDQIFPFIFFIINAFFPACTIRQRYCQRLGNE